MEEQRALVLHLYVHSLAWNSVANNTHTSALAHTHTQDDDTNVAKCILKLKRKYFLLCQPKQTHSHSFLQFLAFHAACMYVCVCVLRVCGHSTVLAEYRPKRKNKRCVRVHPSPSIGIMITNWAPQQENIILASKHYYIHVLSSSYLFHFERLRPQTEAYGMFQLEHILVYICFLLENSKSPLAVASSRPLDRTTQTHAHINLFSSLRCKFLYTKVHLKARLVPIYLHRFSALCLVHFAHLCRKLHVAFDGRKREKRKNTEQEKKNCIFAFHPTPIRTCKYTK